MSTTVSALIKALQAVPDQSATVTVESAGAGTAAALGVIDVSAAANTTPPADAPEAGGQPPAPGTVALSDV